MKRSIQMTALGAVMFCLGALVFGSRSAIGIAPCVTSTPAAPAATLAGTASADQGTQDNPIPLGVTAHVTVNFLSDDYVYDVAITQVLFGEPAIAKLKTGFLYEPPPDGMTYLIAYVQGVFVSGPSGKAANLDSANFITLSDGQLSQFSIIIAPSPELQFKGFPKAKFKGWIALQMAADETNPLIGLGVNSFDGTGGTWFATK